MNINDGLKKIRKEHGKTQQDVESETGINRAYIGAIETGTRTPKEDTLEKILSIYNISEVDFLIDYCGVKRSMKPDTNFDLLNEENQKQVSDYIEFLLARQSFK